MSLTKPALVHADPGRPITAQAWNAIVDAIDGLYDAVNALGGNALSVAVTADGQPRPDARIVAMPAAGGRAIPAIAPFPGQPQHQLAGLTDGAWQLKVTADGCADASIDVMVPATTTAAVSLTVDETLVPDLFGHTVSQALTALAALGLTIDGIVDTAGETVPKVNPPANFQDAVVLLQVPPAGSYAAAGAAQVRLVVSAELQSATVTVPNLAGLTLAEATKALSALGLKIGTTSIAKGG